MEMKVGYRVIRNCHMTQSSLHSLVLSCLSDHLLHVLCFPDTFSCLREDFCQAPVLFPLPCFKCYPLEFLGNQTFFVFIPCNGIIPASALLEFLSGRLFHGILLQLSQTYPYFLLLTLSQDCSNLQTLNIPNLESFLILLLLSYSYPTSQQTQFSLLWKNNGLPLTFAQLSYTIKIFLVITAKSHLLYPAPTQSSLSSTFSMEQENAIFVNSKTDQSFFIMLCLLLSR